MDCPDLAAGAVWTPPLPQSLTNPTEFVNRQKEGKQ